MMNKTQLSKQSPLTIIDELKMKFDSNVKEDRTEKSQPKQLKISKVKEMASMFNIQFSQVLKRDVKYSALKNEFPPEAKPSTKPRSTKDDAKVQKINNYFVADEVVDKMSVKDKALLYSQYIKDLSKIKPKRIQEEELSKEIPPVPAPRTKFGRCVIESNSTPVKTTSSISSASSNDEVAKITPPIPAPRKNYPAVAGSSLFVLAHFSEFDESESGCSSMPKTTTDESQAETIEKDFNDSEKDFDFAKPLKAARKKKLRKNPVWKKEQTLNDINPVISTDSESDCKRTETKIKNKNQQVSQNHNSLKLLMDQTPIRSVHSPRKTKLSFSESINKMEETQNVHFSQTKLTPEIRSLTDSLTDQGFETGSNENVGPKSYQKTVQRTFGFSTPIKDEYQQSFSCTNSAKQQLFSPIDKPVKNRRKSLYDSESRRSSLAMQVIREDQALENDKLANSYSDKKAQSSNAANINKEKLSKFWIKCGDFSLALDICYTNSERLQLLYEIFSQTSCDTKDLHFGIDNHKFSVHNSADIEDLTTRLPVVTGSSHYWFSTGDLAIPFTGKYLSAQKIQRLFNFIKASVEETGILVFGVDDIEFSNVPEFWYEQPKFSMESNYSMLVGLQSGFCNGLEGRSKYAWPHSEPEKVKVTDLDATSYNDEEYFEVIESGRLSYSPFGSNHYDLSALDNDDLSMPRNSDAMLSLETYCYGYENEPLDTLFENNFNQKSINDTKPTETATVAEMLKTMENQQQHLNLVQQGLSSYIEPIYPAEQSLDNLRGTPEYLPKLKNIVNDINDLVSSNKLKECSPKQLESYMFFLSRYAEICLTNCQDQMTSVVENLNDYNGVMV